MNADINPNTSAPEQVEVQKNSIILLPIEYLSKYIPIKYLKF